MANSIEFLEKNSYGQYDIRSSETVKQLEEAGYTIFYGNDNDDNTAGYTYIAEGFAGWDEDYIGSTAYAKTARPLIYNIYKKKENYEEEIKKYEEEKKEEEKREKEEKENLRNGKMKITVEIEEMKRGYALVINTDNGKKFELKQKYVKQAIEATGKEKEELAEYIEKNYEGIRGTTLVLDGEWIRLYDITPEWY